MRSDALAFQTLDDDFLDYPFSTVLISTVEMRGKVVGREVAAGLAAAVTEVEVATVVMAAVVAAAPAEEMEAAAWAEAVMAVAVTVPQTPML